MVYKCCLLFLHPIHQWLLIWIPVRSMISQDKNHNWDNSEKEILKIFSTIQCAWTAWFIFLTIHSHLIIQWKIDLYLVLAMVEQVHYIALDLVISCKWSHKGNYLVNFQHFLQLDHIQELRFIHWCLYKKRK